MREPALDESTGRDSHSLGVEIAGKEDVFDQSGVGGLVHIASWSRREPASTCKSMGSGGEEDVVKQPTASATGGAARAYDPSPWKRTRSRRASGRDSSTWTGCSAD